MLSTFSSVKIKQLPLNSFPAIDHVLEQSLAALLAQEGQKFVADQSDLFFQKFGKVFTGDPFFEDRMNYFNAILVQKFDLQVSSILTHSFFRVKKVTEQALVVYDLLNECDHCIYPSLEQNLTAFNKGSLFQAFLFQQNDNLFLTKAIIFHAPMVLKIIKKKLKLEKSSSSYEHENFLMWLSQREILYSRHKKISPTKIYSEEIYPSILR